MTASAIPAGSTSDTTANLAAITAQFRPFPGTAPSPKLLDDNLTATQVIVPVPTALDALGTKLYFVNQGIKGARFMCTVMAMVLAVYVLATLPDLTAVVWLTAAIAGLLLGLGIWVSFFPFEEKLARARSHRRLTVYFAVTGSMFTVVTILAHMAIWWKMTGQFLL